MRHESRWEESSLGLQQGPSGQPACLERGSFPDGSMHGGSQPTDISLIHRRGSGLVSHHPSHLTTRQSQADNPHPYPRPRGGAVLAAGRARGSGEQSPRPTRALKRRGESGRVKDSLRRASPALDPSRFTRKRNSQIDESDHISPTRFILRHRHRCAWPASVGRQINAFHYV